MKAKKNLFEGFANWATIATGSSAAFIMAISVIIIWGVSGPVFKYSDTWQLVINTGTTIVTFLMVFLIQKSQNKDSKAIHLNSMSCWHHTKVQVTGWLTSKTLRKRNGISSISFMCDYQHLQKKKMILPVPTLLMQVLCVVG